MNLANWKNYDFCAYILLCVADADHHMDMREFHSIEKSIDRLDLGGHHPHQLCDDVFNTFESHSAELRINFVETKWPLFFSKVEDMQVIIEEIEEIILADFTINKKEIRVYNQIRKALGIAHS